MKYFSTNKNAPAVGFREATLKGLAPDGGLYFPDHIPHFSAAFLSFKENYSSAAIGYEIIKPYVGNAIPEETLKKIAEETLDFNIPLVSVTDSIYALELFHGPTLAFKDVGARFMSRCLGYFAQDIKQRIVVLVATSGDTGSAVANGFYKVPGIDVLLLYPSGKVSSVQEKQLTTLGENIHALEVKGNFDDCQRMVKAMFADEDLNKKMFLTSANSINIARWLPQQFYYAIAWQQWPDKRNPPVVSVPSGNFGNICAGMLAHKSGLPVKTFISGLNANDVVLKYLASENYTPGDTISTIANAMDVGDPSNFVRLLELFDHDFEALKKSLQAYRYDDGQIKQIIKRVFEDYKYLCDPHGAIAYAALEAYLDEHKSCKGIFLETAHPLKFYDVVEPVIDVKIPIPPTIAAQLEKEKSSTIIENNEEALRAFLTDFCS